MAGAEIEIGVHVGTKKSPSGNTGLNLFQRNRGDRPYYASKQVLAIIEIFDNRYKQFAYFRRGMTPSTPFSLCADASQTQGKRRIIHDFTPARSKAGNLPLLRVA
jgi:hypothetical protein